MAATIFQILLGIALLFGGGEVLLRGVLRLALAIKIPAAIIGLTVVAYGTGIPELIVSVDAAHSGSPDIALGNAIGSTICSVLLILGLTSLIVTLYADATLAKRDGSMMVAAAALLGFLSMDGEISRVEGGVLLALLMGYTLYCYRTEGERLRGLPELTASRTSAWTAGAYAAMGLALLITGSDVLVDGAVGLAREFSVSEAAIGLTIVAVGTSLPELVTSLIAALKRRGDIAFANIIGSNLFSLLGIVGLSALVTPISVAPQFLGFDIWVMLASFAGVVGLFASGRVIDRRIGAVFVALFIGYVLYQFHF